MFSFDLYGVAEGVELDARGDAGEWRGVLAMHCAPTDSFWLQARRQMAPRLAERATAAGAPQWVVDGLEAVGRGE